MVGDGFHFNFGLTKRFQLSFPHNLLCLVSHHPRRTQVVIVQVMHLHRGLRGQCRSSSIKTAQLRSM